PRPLARITVVELDEGAADLDAWLLRRTGRGVAEAEPLVGSGRRGGVAREQGGVVEVVVDVGPPFDEPQSEALVDVEVGLSISRRADTEFPRKPTDRRPKIRPAEGALFQRAPPAGTFGLEQGQLPA